jgi:hypothetical protein
MDANTKKEAADYLDRIANQEEWDPEEWQRCHDMVKANWDNELLAYVYDDLVHYSGEFHSLNIFGFRAKPDPGQLQHYRQEFRDIASALRDSLSLDEAKRKYEL